jgi:hypothetical protein
MQEHMIPSGAHDGNSRRSFLLSSGGWLSSAWMAAHWPAIAAAAQHAEAVSAARAPAFEFFNAAEAADVEAISAQILPGGATPGAREAHAVYFIDRALATFFAGWSAGFRSGLTEFQAKFRAGDPAAGAPAAGAPASASFAEAGPEKQFAHLKTVERTPFFNDVRRLTLLGMFSSPKYGGNYGGAGWSMMGFKDQHAFTPPFGYYDREYTGFVPYAPEKHS